ncbi:Bestrophin, RFP-TM, chloride channel-domain-containing protein [Suillus occidentalis]|nr:Bestrophin, RFP-TM, chloride channel-domain-containing protein [Suillus occidentalis]
MSRPPTYTTYSSIDSFEATQTIHNSPTFWDTLSTTALNRCWPVLICTGIWSSALCVLNHYTHGKLSIQPTLITVFGTVLGFVISFRTTSSFERYNEGRKYWSQIVLNCRTFGRTVWFHVPGAQTCSSSSETEQGNARSLIEKKTVVNLLEAYAVSVKHYLRGEDGINYEDLYPLVSFLSLRSYSLPTIIPSLNAPELHRRLTHASTLSHNSHDVPTSSGTTQAPVSPYRRSVIPLRRNLLIQILSLAKESAIDTSRPRYDEEYILPSEMRPVNSWRKAFPFSFFFWVWTIIQHDAGKTAGVNDARSIFRYRKHNVPLEISLFLSSYISALQTRKVVDAPTITLLYTTLNQLVDALTGLERILTTPIPVSYSSHLWMVTLVYCIALPFQLWSTLEWLTIPASVIASFIFFGFVVAGEEIESYDRNDLNMDHFVQNIIRKELRAITSTRTPDPAEWAFSPQNDFLGTLSRGLVLETPSAWLQKGKAEILTALHG